MEVFAAENYYILQHGEHGLWCHRKTGKYELKTGWDLLSTSNPVCLGIVYGFLGKIRVLADLDERLLLIRSRTLVGTLPNGCEVYKITGISFLTLSLDDTNNDLVGLEPCKKHSNSSQGKIFSGGGEVHKAMVKTWGTIKSATNTIKHTTAHAAAMAAQQVKPLKKKGQTMEKERFEKRLLEELQRMMGEMDSFYYSPTADLTNSIQCQYKEGERGKGDAIWREVDSRFFWNKKMLQELIESNDPLADPWILPVIQGFVQIEPVSLELAESPGQRGQTEQITIILISRRSRHRAGTRYKRRGVDDRGKCANYVESEQIIAYRNHTLSFVQVRGSVPVFWSQPGYKYRPPPRLDRGEEETHQAFVSHFTEECSIYSHVNIVNLVEQNGKEKIIASAYLNHVLEYDSPDVTYISFNFHEYCRGMHFENVCVLVESIEDVIRSVGYCWIDKVGVVCRQKGVFRVNCIDCLDRTNVVQTALAKAVLEIQFTKLGLIAPEGNIPQNVRSSLQNIWANNGDTISKQYAGTSALKGDYTRTGERKLSGLMKDGVNSANRYYLNRFKDAYRQATIDMMQGKCVSEAILNVDKGNEEETAISAEHVKQLIEDCKKMLVSEQDVILGAWGLIDADPDSGSPMEMDLDSILILTRDSYYYAEYDDETDQVTSYQQVYLCDVELIEFGQDQASSLFKGSHSFHCMRLSYRHEGQSGYIHTFRSSRLRFFNNVAVEIKNEEEMIESVKAICESFLVALQVLGYTGETGVSFLQGKLERKKSKQIMRRTRNNPLRYLDLPNLPSMTRNVSETQLAALKTVGSKAISNMTSQFAKLKPQSIRQSFRFKTKSQGMVDEIDGKKPMFELGDEDNSTHVTEQQNDKTHYSSNSRQDMLLDSCGILYSAEGSSQLCSPNYGYDPSCRSVTPEITVAVVDGNIHSIPIALQNAQHLSHSSSEVIPNSQTTLPTESSDIIRSTSEKDINVLSMKVSHSDTAMLPQSALFSNPLGKLARSLGANLDPRKIRLGGNKSTVNPEEYEKLMERRKNCKTRIIEL